MARCRGAEISNEALGPRPVPIFYTRQSDEDRRGTVGSPRCAGGRSAGHVDATAAFFGDGARKGRWPWMRWPISSGATPAQLGHSRCGGMQLVSRDCRPESDSPSFKGERDRHAGDRLRGRCFQHGHGRESDGSRTSALRRRVMYARPSTVSASPGRSRTARACGPDGTPSENIVLDQQPEHTTRSGWRPSSADERATRSCTRKMYYTWVERGTGGIRTMVLHGTNMRSDVQHIAPPH